MQYKTVKLEELCSIKTGAPVGRAKKLEDGETGREVKVLIPKAMADAKIIDSELATEVIGSVHSDHFTREGDVIIKLSTPYDSAYVDETHEGILVTSFSMVLRCKEPNKINMVFLAMLLNSEHLTSILQARSSSSSGIKLLRRHDIADLDIPIVPLQKQEDLASLFYNISKRKSQYQKLIELDDELLNSQLMQSVWGD